MRPSPFWFLLTLALGFSPVMADEPQLPLVQVAAAKGDPVAEQELGRAYQLGEGLPVDYARALDWYRKSAAQGNARAMHNLGLMYHMGKGVPADQKQAANWLLQAAGKDLPAAELAVGTAYQSGSIGLTKDDTEAVKWLTKAASHTEAPNYAAPAANLLGVIYDSGKAAAVGADKEKAVAWYKKAADFNYAKAEANLGIYYHAHVEANGKPDLVTSYMWLRLAAVQQEVLSEHLLSEMVDGKELTDVQVIEADKRANDFRVAHKLDPLPLPHLLMTPATMMLKGKKPMTSQELSAPTTNAVAAPVEPAAK